MTRTALKPKEAYRWWPATAQVRLNIWELRELTTWLIPSEKTAWISTFLLSLTIRGFCGPVGLLFSLANGIFCHTGTCPSTKDWCYAFWTHWFLWCYYTIRYYDKISLSASDEYQESGKYSRIWSRSVSKIHKLANSCRFYPGREWLTRGMLLMRTRHKSLWEHSQETRFHMIYDFIFHLSEWKPMDHISKTIYSSHTQYLMKFTQ